MRPFFRHAASTTPGGESCIDDYVNLVIAIIRQAKADLVSPVLHIRYCAEEFLSPHGAVWEYVEMLRDIDHEDGVETWWSRRESERRLHSNVTTSLS